MLYTTQLHHFVCVPNLHTYLHTYLTLSHMLHEWALFRIHRHLG